MTETKTTSLEAAVLDKLRARAAERGVSLLSIPLAVLRHKIMPLIETEDQKAAFAMNRLWLGDAKNFKPQSLKLEGETLIDWLSKASRQRPLYCFTLPACRFHKTAATESQGRGRTYLLWPRRSPISRS